MTIACVLAFCAYAKQKKTNVEENKRASANERATKARFQRWRARTIGDLKKKRDRATRRMTEARDESLLARGVRPSEDASMTKSRARARTTAHEARRTRTTEAAGDARKKAPAVEATRAKAWVSEKKDEVSERTKATSVPVTKATSVSATRATSASATRAAPAPVASEARTTGWKPVRNQAADRLREVTAMRRVERRQRIQEQIRLKSERARAAEAEASLRAELRAAQNRERDAALERKRVEEIALKKTKELEAKARSVEELRLKQENEIKRQVKEAKLAAEAKEAAALKARDESARAAQAQRDAQMRAEKAALEKQAAERERLVKQREERLVEASKKVREDVERETQKKVAAKNAEFEQRERALKAAENARVAEARAKAREEFISKIKAKATSAAERVKANAPDLRRFLYDDAVTAGTKPAAKAAPGAKKDQRKTSQVAQAQSWSAPKMPDLNLTTGGYATLGFASSLILASILSVGVRASRQNRARRRAERVARLEADKLRQKDRWASAIDTDTVSPEAAARAERDAERDAANAPPSPSPVDSERDRLQKAYDTFLKASKADKKIKP